MTRHQEECIKASNETCPRPVHSRWHVCVVGEEQRLTQHPCSREGSKHLSNEGREEEQAVPSVADCVTWLLGEPFLSANVIP